LNEPPSAAGKIALVLRHTVEEDLVAVLAIERHPDNAPFIGRWPREHHKFALMREGTEHLVLVDGHGAIAGYLIAYDLVADGFGIWIQRIAVRDKARGVGRAVLAAYLAEAMPRLGADSAILDAMQANVRAQRMYRSIGFVPVTLPHDELTSLEHLVGGIDRGDVVMRLEAKALRGQERYEVHLA
jgi:ribosomal protein S18 acetylase RimI-like enzyme